MSRRRRIISHIRSNLVAYVALFFALSGTAYAAGGLLIYSDNIVDGQVFSVDVADDNLTSLDVQNGSLTGGDLANGTVSGQQITNESVTRADIAPDTLTGVEVADNSLTGADVGWDRLTGDDIAENTLSVAGMGCQSGKVLGFARVKGIALSQDQVDGWTSDPKYVDNTNNCSGGEVLVRRAAGWDRGLYYVKFVGNPAALAVATNNADGSPVSADNDTGLDDNNDDNILSVAKEYSADEGGYFRVEVQDVCRAGTYACNQVYAPTVFDRGNFTILLP
jgi:hypothetical protein